MTDTLGATALTVSGSNPVVFSYTNPQGGSSSYKLNYSTKSIRTNFGCSGICFSYPTAQERVVTFLLSTRTASTYRQVNTHLSQTVRWLRIGNWYFRLTPKRFSLAASMQSRGNVTLTAALGPQNIPFSVSETVHRAGVRRMAKHI